MKVQFLALIAALGVCDSTAVRSSEPKAQLSYYCKPQIASGISFNDRQKEWVPTPFEPGKAFVLTLKYLGETTHKNYPGVFKTFDTYNITITYEGEDHKSSCIGMTLPDSDVVEVVEGDVVRCSRYFGDVFFFHPRTNRFLEAYLRGYLEGDQPGNTPAVTAGVCTKIN